MGKLFSLFDEKLRSPSEFVAGPVKTLDTLGSSVEETDYVLRKIKQLEISRPKVDYSDFSNFVFFNSALDYFNLTGEKILNEYPFDGTREQTQAFVDALDDYQKYVIDVWPKNSAHLRFDPSLHAYVSVDDVVRGGTTSVLSPGTSSFSLEFWCVPPPTLTGSNDVMFIAQKFSGSYGSVSAFFTGSALVFQVSSGSTTDSLSCASNPGQATYYCLVGDRSSDSLIMRAYSGSSTEFPSLVTYSTGTITGPINSGPERMYFGSGTLSSKVTRPLTGSIGEIRFWNSAQTIENLSSSFNTRIYRQDNLVGIWRFSESGSLSTSTTRDFSGNGLDGLIVNYDSSMRSSGSLNPYGGEDLILTLDAPEISSYILEQQTSGAYYDRFNSNQMTMLFPEQFFLLEEIKGTTVLKDFVNIIARSFDQIKVSIDQFVNVLKADYGEFDQVPDALLQDVAKFFGWEFTGNFLNSDAVQYIVGKQVLANTESNKELDVKLYQIKNEFWKRTLINLMHIYKTKGTRESVESLMRVYGVDKNFIRLKEFGKRPVSGIETFRISSEKSAHVIVLSSGSYPTPTECFVSSSLFSTNLSTVETRIRFPTLTTTNLTASLATGSIWTCSSGSGIVQKLYYEKSDYASMTGNIVFSSSEGTVSLSNAPVFDGRWYNVLAVKNIASSSLVLDVRSVDSGEFVYNNSATAAATLSSSPSTVAIKIGSSGALGAHHWMQELRVWERKLTETDIVDHCLDFQSYGSEASTGFEDLSLHWRLDDSSSTDSSGNTTVFDSSGNSRTGSGQGFPSDTNIFEKFLFDYSYIASPEMGWNEEKVRSIDASYVSPENAFVDDNVVSLEFNLVDALNEDISRILSTIDMFNEAVGSAVNKYRDSYDDIDKLRFEYFKSLSGRVNFRVFADLLEFFDRSFIDMVRRLIPARASFIGDEFVVESHMLERPKLQWNYRRKDPEFRPGGTIKVFIR